MMALHVYQLNYKGNIFNIILFWYNSYDLENPALFLTKVIWTSILFNISKNTF